MKIILSPAKKMHQKADDLEVAALPRFLPEAERLLGALRRLSYAQLKALWRCSDAIARQNAERLAHMDLRRNLTPALFSYDGIQYRHMAPGVFTGPQFGYAQAQVRILSGFYGLLRPFDGVTPYRLEMQAKLPVGKSRDLYVFWGGKLAQALCEEEGERPCILNLASKEYSSAVEGFLPPSARFVTCKFLEETNGKAAEKGTLCKMARGEMARYFIVRGAEAPEVAKEFTGLGFRFLPERSNDTTYVFWRQGKGRA